MKVHLFATDKTALALPHSVQDELDVTAVIVPENRRSSKKVQQLREECALQGVGVFEQSRQSAIGAISGLPHADAGVSWLYTQILPASDLKRYPGGLLNMHGGKIPEYRGSNVLHWAIVNGESELGVTWHEMVAEVDAGPIWYEGTIPISSDATAADMRRALITAAIASFAEAWERFASRAEPVRIPDLARGQVWPRRGRKDARIRSGLTIRELRDLLRACVPPWPRAWVDSPLGPVEIEGLDTGADGLAYQTSDSRTVFLRPAPR